MEFAQQVKSQVDIVSVVREYVPTLKKAGSRWVGLCPFHTEKTPSFGVHAVHQFYKCFGCGQGGDVIKFVMEIEGLTFWEAVKLLAERHGIPVPKQPAYSDEETRLRAAVYEMHELAQQIFRQTLESGAGAAARKYILARGVAPETVEEFGLGFADRSGQTLVQALQRRGFTRDQMAASGLVLERDDGSGWFDRFRGRLMFPIHNESGKVIAFAGRALGGGGEPKYLNSPETPIYRKSYVLYNLHRAKRAVRQAGRAILVEGYMDVIGLYQAGVGEVVASCGTALTQQQIRGLRRHAGKVVVNFDPDAAGSGAAERSIEMLLSEGVNVRVLELEGGLDPDEYVKQRGAEAYRERLDEAPGCFEWLVARARKRFDCSTAEGRVEGFRQVVLPALKRLPDRLQRAAAAEEAAALLRVDAGLVRREFRKLGVAADRSDTPAQTQVDAKEKMFVNLLLKSAEARKVVLPRLAELNAVREFRTWPLLRTMLMLEQQQPGWGYLDIENRLGEEEKRLLASLVFADALEDEESALEQAAAFLPKLERKDRESRMAALREQIRDAERSGDLAAARRLTEELERLARR